MIKSRNFYRLSMMIMTPKQSEAISLAWSRDARKLSLFPRSKTARLISKGGGKKTARLHHSSSVQRRWHGAYPAFRTYRAEVDGVRAQGPRPSQHTTALIMSESGTVGTHARNSHRFTTQPRRRFYCKRDETLRRCMIRHEAQKFRRR